MNPEYFNKLQNSIDMIKLVQDKNEVYKDNVISQINFIERQLDKASHDLQYNSQEECIENLKQSLLQQKPLTHIETSNRKIYKYFSKLGKKIESLKTFPDDLMTFNNISFDHKSLKEAIAEFILFYSINNSSDEEIDTDMICTELGLLHKGKLDTKLQNMKEIRKIETDLSQKQLQSLLQWLNHNLNKLTKQKSDLPFKVYKAYIIQLKDSGVDQEEIFQQAQKLFSQISKISQNKIQIFMMALFFTKQNIQQYYYQEQTTEQNSIKEKQEDNYLRDQQQEKQFIEGLYQRYNSELIIDWEDLKQEFFKNVYEIYEICPKNPLFEVFKAGIESYPFFLKNGMKLDNNFLESVEVSIPLNLDKKFNYHNLIVCPVTKEICTNDNPPVLLNCGHVISDSSAKKLAKMDNQGRKNNFKCPICPQVQSYNEIRILNIKQFFKLKLTFPKLIFICQQYSFYQTWFKTSSSLKQKKKLTKKIQIKIFFYFIFKIELVNTNYLNQEKILQEYFLSKSN